MTIMKVVFCSFFPFVLVTLSKKLHDLSLNVRHNVCLIFM